MMILATFATCCCYEYENFGSFAAAAAGPEVWLPFPPAGPRIE